MRSCKDVDELGDLRLQQVGNWRDEANLVYSGKGVDKMATRECDEGAEEKRNAVDGMSCGGNETTWDADMWSTRVAVPALE